MFSNIKRFVVVLALTLTVLGVVALTGCGGSSGVSEDEGQQIIQEYEEGTLEPSYEYGETNDSYSEGELEEAEIERCYAEAQTEEEEWPCVEMSE